MLTLFRSFMKSLIFRIALFGLLIASFALWGTSDLLTERVSGQNVAEVGDVAVSGIHFQRQYSGRRQNLINSGLDPSLIRQYGLPETTLQDLVNRALFQAESHALGLRASQQAVQDAVRNTEFFQGPDGEFSAVVMKRALNYNNLSVSEYYELVESDFQIIALQDAVWSSHQMAGVIRDFSYLYRQESRNVDYITIEVNDLTLPNDADDATLRSYYDSNTENFREPERRVIEYIYVTVADLEKVISPTNAMLEQYYQENIANYSQAETRSYQFIRFGDAVEAQAFTDKITEASDFKRLADQQALTIIDNELTIQQNIVDSALAESVFALDNITQWSQPVQGELGYYIVLLGEIVPALVKPLDSVRADIRTQVIQDEAINAYITKLSAAEELSISGNDLEEIAESIDEQIRRTPAISNFGTTNDGTNVGTRLPPDRNFTQEAFNAIKNATSYVYTIGQTGFYLIRVQDVATSFIPEFDMITNRVRTEWESQQRQMLARQIIDELKQRLTDGAAFSSLASNGAYNIQSESGLSRQNDVFDASLTQKIFVTPQNKAVDGQVGDIYYLVNVTNITIPDETNIAQLNADSAEEFNQFADNFEGRYQSIIQQSYENTLRIKHKPRINQALFTQLIRQLEGNP
ncbi:MAG: peptidyl-prolyl cis-trans isomerase [Alphaproteobacteria bacterium]|nr:peptidyl-prolyl cis-trans isomerase [Alphaproteobacteria bacterium]